MPGDAPDVPTAQEEAQAQIGLERERAKLAAEQSAADKAAADADKAQKVAKATGKQATNYDAALDYGNKQTTNRGLDQGLVDQYGVGNMYKDELDNTRRNFAEDDTSAQYGEKTAYDDVLSQATNRYRGDLGKQFDTFAGDGFATNDFADTTDDDILSSILGGQYNDTLSQIDASKARGTLNGTGYSKALEKLNQQKLAGNSQIQTLGQGVLGGYRTQLDTLANNGRVKASGATFDNPFDTSSVQGQLDQLRGSLSGRLEGDLYNATSGQSFFDPSSILSYGGQQQGMFNPSKQAGAGGGSLLLDAFTDPTKKNAANPLDTSSGNGAF